MSFSLSRLSFSRLKCRSSILNQFSSRFLHVEETAETRIRLSKIISTKGQNMQMSHRSVESLIFNGQATFTGKTIMDPGYKLSLNEASSGGGTIKVASRRLLFPSLKIKGSKSVTAHSQLATTQQEKVNQLHHKLNPPSIATQVRVWLANKLPRELVSEHDPQGRPSLLERLSRGGVGKSSYKRKKGFKEKIHLKAVGRLDMMTEGLILVTNDGGYAREMELPKNKYHRTYRARVFGQITPGKLKALRNGVIIDGMRYKGVKAQMELARNNGRLRGKGGSSNSWLRITCVEGKNQQIRRMLDHLGCE